MASVTVVHRWADGSAVSVCIDLKPNYPDAIDEARSQAVRGVRDLVGEFAEQAEDESGD